LLLASIDWGLVPELVFVVVVFHHLVILLGIRTLIYASSNTSIVEISFGGNIVQHLHALVHDTTCLHITDRTQELVVLWQVACKVVRSLWLAECTFRAHELIHDEPALIQFLDDSQNVLIVFHGFVSVLSMLNVSFLEVLSFNLYVLDIIL